MGARRVLSDVPLRRMLAGSHLVVQVATLLAVTVGLYFMVARYLWHSSIERTQVQMNNIWAHRWQVPLTIDSWCERVSPRFSENLGSGLARFFTLDGQVVAAAGSLHAPLPTPRDLERLRQDIGRGRSHGFAHRYREGGTDYQILLVPLHDGTQTTMAMQLAVDWTSAEGILHALGSYLVVLALAGLMLSQVVSFWLARQMSGSLERLAAAAQQLAGGNLAARTGMAGGRNEVLAVATSFDRMADRLQAVFAQQKRFVADASHELKTPLTAIGGMAEMLTEGADEDDPAQRQLALTTIQREVDRMNAIVNDLLILSRAEQGPAPRLEQVDLDPIVSDTVELFRLKSPQHAIQWSSCGHVWALGSPEDLTRVVRNLVENAVKYTPAGGTVTVECTPRERDVLLIVSDTGIGISAEDLPHVFEPFYRADRSRARRTGGSGLGLSIVQTVAERVGGSVRIESAPNVGTRVEVRLPLGAGGSPPSQPAPTKI